MKNKLTLISGAGRGIGEAIAKKFYKEGHDLILLIHKLTLDIMTSLELWIQKMNINMVDN